MSDRERLRALIEDLPESEVQAALRFVEYLRSSAPPEAPPATEEEEARHGRILSHEGMRDRVFGKE
jgi:hypothetical protein